MAKSAYRVLFAILLVFAIAPAAGAASRSAAPISEKEGPGIAASCSSSTYINVWYSTVESQHVVNCSASMNSITVNGDLRGPNGTRYGTQYCYYTSRCTLYISQTRVSGYWYAYTSGSASPYTYVYSSSYSRSVY